MPHPTVKRFSVLYFKFFVLINVSNKIYGSGGSDQVYFLLGFDIKYIWDKVFKNGPSEICGRLPLKKFEVSHCPIYTFLIKPDRILDFNYH